MRGRSIPARSKDISDCPLRCLLAALPDSQEKFWQQCQRFGGRTCTSTRSWSISATRRKAEMLNSGGRTDGSDAVALSDCSSGCLVTGFLVLARHFLASRWPCAELHKIQASIGALRPRSETEDAGL